MSSVLPSLVQEMNQAFNEGKDFIMPVKGTSMLPFIKDGEAVVLVPPEYIKKHDIIFYERENEHYVLHRIYKVKNNAYVLLGDHQINKEYPIYPHQVLAKVKYVISDGKKKELKGFKYRLYLFFFRSRLLRRVYFKIFLRNNKK